MRHAWLARTEVNAGEEASRIEMPLDWIRCQVERTQEALKEGSSSRRTELRYINWSKPTPGWVKINADGISAGKPGNSRSRGPYKL